MGWSKKLREVKVMGDTDIDFFFEGTTDPFDATEFQQGTRTRTLLDQIEDLICEFNDLPHDQSIQGVPKTLVIVPSEKEGS